MDAELTFRTAGTEDTEVVIALLDDTAAWLIARGIRQWGVGDFTLETQKAIPRGQVYLALVNGEPAGTFRLQDSDPTIWGEDDIGQAFYVHRLATNRQFAGLNLGTAMLHEAARLTRDAGKPYLRLDCHADNPTLCAYYSRQGFTLVRRIHLGGWHCAMFEKHLDSFVSG